MFKPYTQALFLVAPLWAVSTQVSALALPAARLAASPAISGPTPRGVQISPDGVLITYLKAEANDQNTFDLWSRPVRGGQPRLLVDGSKLEPQGVLISEAEKSRRERQRQANAHGVLDYRWDENGLRILIPAGGDLYLLEMKTLALQKIGDTKGQAIDGRLSPDGGFITFVRDQNLHALELKTGRDRALTADGQGPVSFGVAEFVAQEEMGRFSGYWASPDDRLIAYARVDEVGVDIVPRLDIGPEGITQVAQRYPRPGRPNAKVTLYVAPLKGGTPVAVDLGPDQDIYIARVLWSKDGKGLYVERENRPQTQLDLLKVDPETGIAKVLVRETQSPWINLNDDLTPLKNGDFLWGSERSGFHHLYLYSGDGRLIRPVTSGPWPVAEGGGSGLHPAAVAGVDETRGLVYFSASKESPLQRDFYVTSYLRADAPRRITGGEGWWSVDLSQDHKTFVGVYSDPKTPPQTGLFSIDGQRLSWIEANTLGPNHPFFPYLDHKTFPEFGALKAEDGQTLYYALTKPSGFDPAQRHPAIVRVYGGPDVLPTVRKTWQSDGTDQLLTQAGYVVFWLDNRGTSNRGVAFEAPIHKAMGSPEVRDQLVGERFLAALPYIDPKRIGVMGWSYGGYMTMRLLTEPQSGFAAGAAGAPPSDWRLYDTHYTERYMGDPNIDAAAYDAAAVVPRLGELAKPGAPRLLLLQGMADDNVVFENSTRIMAALEDQSTPFDLMLYPGQRHRIGAPAKQLQLWETYLAFFERTLGSHP